MIWRYLKCVGMEPMRSLPFFRCPATFKGDLFFPHIFVCLFLLCASGRRPPPSVATLLPDNHTHTHTLSHTTHPHAHNSLKHTTYPQTTHSHTQLPHPQLPHRPHTRQNWIFEVIHQELSLFICKLDRKHSNLSSIIRIMEGTPKWPSWLETRNAIK